MARRARSALATLTAGLIVFVLFSIPVILVGGPIAKMCGMPAVYSELVHQCLSLLLVNSLLLGLVAYLIARGLQKGDWGLSVYGGLFGAVVLTVEVAFLVGMFVDSNVSGVWRVNECATMTLTQAGDSVTGRAEVVHSNYEFAAGKYQVTGRVRRPHWGADQLARLRFHALSGDAAPTSCVFAVTGGWLGNATQLFGLEGSTNVFERVNEDISKPQTP